MKMFRGNRQEDEQLDRLGRVMLRSAAGDEAEVEAAASAPFLFTRLRATIAEEQRRRDETGGWLPVLFVARKAVPAMALVAVLAATLTVWTAQPATPTAGRFDEEGLGLFEARDAGVEQTILANSNGLSGDEVFGIVVEREKQ